MPFIYFYIFLLVHPYLAFWWKSFPKMGRQSWEALIPIYNYAIIFKVTCKKPFWALLLLIPGVHLVMWMVANASYLRRFGYFSFADSLQAIFFPYLLSYKATKEDAVFGPETNWSNSRDIEIRKWADHIVLFLCLPVIGHVLVLGTGAFQREKPGEKSRVKEWGDSLLFALVAASIIRTYVFEPFQIPTGSMEKTLLVGDFLFVNKLAYGSKVPVTPLSYPLVHNTVPFINLQSYTTFEKGKYTRLPGFGKVKRYDVVVFNYPSGDTAVYDPRMPNGLMGHDYHGILNDEAFFLYQNDSDEQNKVNQLVNSLRNQGKTNEQIDSILSFQRVNYFIQTNAKWKQLAREKLARGEFPGEPNGMKHGGLIYRPVDKRENYIKRCVGIPGDKLKIEASVLYVNGKKAEVAEFQCLQYEIERTKITFPGSEEMCLRYGLENAPDGTRLDFNDRSMDKYVLTLTKAEKQQIEKDFKIKLSIVRQNRYPEMNYSPTAYDLLSNVRVFPKDFYINNTTTDFQEFTVPAKGMTVKIDSKNIAWYRRIITAYEGHKLEEKKDGIYIDGKKVTSYTFAMNYYWLMGDNRYNSADSRIWGFVPEDHVVGRASLVWMSKSAYVDSFMGFRFNRFFKWIQ